jgi:N-acylneuraminate cytidylyltransferase
MNKKIALIPARSGSKRLPNKNLAEIGGHPMIAYTINACIESRIFDQVIVSTNSEEIAEVAKQYGAEIPELRPSNLAEDNSPDIDWIKLAINAWLDLKDEDLYSILRPTNPLRHSNSIISAYEKFIASSDAHSLRAVKNVREHPKKMWVSETEDFISPFIPHINEITGVEGHSTPTQLLGTFYIQDASLEISRTWVARRLNSLTGTRVIPFQLPNFEGFDINYPEDLEFVRYLINIGKVSLPNLNAHS